MYRQAVLATLLLAALKLAHVVSLSTWTWLWVLSPVLVVLLGDAAWLGFLFYRRTGALRSIQESLDELLAPRSRR